ncbi:MAG: hypothetical protein WBV51_14635, partial [Pseudolabrys sp.]
GLPLRLLVCAAKEFDLEQHPITMVSRHARFHPLDVLVLALSEHLDRAFDVCFWDGMIFCGANVR